MDQMQSPILPWISKRFVASIDDRAVVLHPLKEIVLDVIRPLADLERDRRFGTRQFEIERKRICLPYSSGASENLPRREKTEQRAEHRRRELRFAPHEVVLMAAECRAGLVIDVVLDE